MKAVSWVLIILGTASSLPAQNATHSDLLTGATPTPSLRDKHFDLIIESLNRTTWREEDSACYTQLLLLLQNVKNNTLWATWIWDSNQLPAGVMSGARAQLGSYDACMRAPWRPPQRLRTRYCLTTLRLSRPPYHHRPQFDPYGSTQHYFQNVMEYVIGFNKLLWGVCVPGECGPGAVTKLVTSLLATTHLAPMSADHNVTSVECLDSESRNIPVNYSFIYVTCILFLITLVATYYGRKYEDEKKNPRVMNVAKSFCLIRNNVALTREFKNEIKCLNGIRFLSTFAVVFTHCHASKHFQTFVNGLQVKEITDTLLGKLVNQSNIAVDTFFVMSAMLLVKTNMSRGMSNPLAIILKRYCRLLFPLMMAMLPTATLMAALGDGPLWLNYVLDRQKQCHKNWWKDFAMISNYNIGALCNDNYWYISCDFQLTVVGVILLFIWHKQKIVGTVIFAVVFIVATLIPGLATFYRMKSEDLSQVAYLDLTFPANAHFTILDVYFSMLSRLSVYLVGMATGYWMCKRDGNKHFTKINSFVLLASSIITMGTIATWGADLRFNPDRIGVWAASVYVALSKVAHAAAICALICCCQYGYVPIINNILCWRPFVPLGRLSYGIYLIHCYILMRFVYVARTTINMDIYTSLVESVGVVMLSGAASWALWLLVEAPVSRLCQLQYSAAARN